MLENVKEGNSNFLFLLFGLKMQLYAVLICMYDTICGFVWSCIHLRQMGWKWLFQLFSHSSCFCMCTVLYYQKLCTIITGAKPSNLLIRSKKNYQVEISFILTTETKPILIGWPWPWVHLGLACLGNKFGLELNCNFWNHHLILV